MKKKYHFKGDAIGRNSDLIPNHIYNKDAV